LQYYDRLGFDHVYLYCNDDDPAELAAAVAATSFSRRNFVSFTHFLGQGQQIAMYRHALVRARNESEWLSFLDVDEFLALHDADTIGAFVERQQPDIDSIHFNWLNFGNNHFVERPEGSVLENYTRRSPSIDPHTKHLSRAKYLTEARLMAASFPFWHGLSDPAWSDLKRVNVLGDDIAPLLKDFPNAARRYLSDPARANRIMSTAVVNHYAFKSEQDLVWRARRGLGGQFAGQEGWSKLFEAGGARALLGEMTATEDTFLRDLGRRTQHTEVVRHMPSFEIKSAHRRVHVRHALWEDDLILGDDGRVVHASHGTTGAFYQAGRVLHVLWDKYADDIFVDHGHGYTHIDLAPIDLRRPHFASVGNLSLSVSSILVNVPDDDVALEVRPATSDVDVLNAVYFWQEYGRPRLAEPVSAILDLGANIGLASRYYASLYPDATIIAVEPDVSNYRILDRNSSYSTRIKPLRAAVWSSDTTLDLRKTDDAGNFLGDWGVRTVVADNGNVPAYSITTLMAKFGLRQIDLLKIDIEGSELELFEAEDAKLWLQQTRCIVVETHDRFRPGSNDAVSRALADDFVEEEPNGENRVFVRRGTTVSS
jgi:FkbM family methyltransferase